MGDTRVVKNASWIIGSRVVQALLSLVISMLTARFLGPGNYGLISYAASVVAFLLPVMKLGLDAVLVRELINHPEQEGQTLGSALVLNLISGFLCMAGAVCFCLVASPGEWETLAVCALYSLLMPAQALEMVHYWYQAKLLSKYTALISLGAYVLVSAYKVWLLASGKSVYWFAVSNALDSVLIAGALHLCYRRLGGSALRFSGKRAVQLLSKGRYYILSAMMVTVFAQTDRIMLKLYLDETAVGYYTAALTCAGITSFVFSALIDSMRPAILESKKNGGGDYETRLRRLYAMVIFLSLAQSIPVTLLSELMIRLLYGQAYLQAAPALRIVVWFTAFSYYGGAKDIWILAEEKQKYLVWLNLSGAVANVALNAVLIPVWGICGAAAASLVTQFFTNIVMGFVIRPLRHNNLLLLQALHPKYLKETVSDLVHTLRRLPEHTEN